jgi:Ca2+-binding RTX toxin-like protein
VFPLGITTVVCTATDYAGNTDSLTFTVTVRDTTPPAVTVPAALTGEATGPFGAPVTFAVSASDVVSGPVAVSCLPASGTMFSLGTRTVLCRAVDAAGNWGGGSFTVTVVDTTPPIITRLGEALVRVAVGSVYVDAGAAAADLVDGDLTAAIVAVNPVDTGAPGDFVVTYDVADSHGNAAVQVTRQVRVAYFCDGQEATIWGTDGADTLTGTAGPDVIVGLGGDDTIYGLGGDDLVCSGAGDDILFGGDGDDGLRGGAGDDRLVGGAGDDLLGGGAGRDVVDFHLAGAPMTVNLLAGTATGAGSDRLRLVEDVIGSRFGDLLIGGPRPSVVRGGLGDDVIRGGGAGDTLWGGVGNDHLYGNGGDDFLWGGPGNDVLVGGLGHDTLDGVPE